MYKIKKVSNLKQDRQRIQSLEGVGGRITVALASVGCVSVCRFERHFRLPVHDGWRKCEILESYPGSYAAVNFADSLRPLRASKAGIRLLDSSPVQYMESLDLI